MKQLVDFAGSRPNIAYLYAALGNFTLAVGQMFFKQLTAYLHPFQVIFIRSLCITLMNLCLMRRDDKNPYIRSPENFFRVISRISVNTFSFIVMFYCLRHIPVSTVSTIFNTGPIFIFFIELLHYKTNLSLPNLLLTLLSFTGVILLIQPDFIFGASENSTSDHYTFYVCLMILSAFANALNLHFIHGLAKKIDPIVNMHYSHLGMLTASGILCNFSPIVMDSSLFSLNFILLILCMSLVGIFAQNLIFLANSLQKPSLMMPFGYVGVATGFLMDLYLFDISFSLLSITGIFLTSGGLLSGFLLQKLQSQSEKPKEVSIEVQKMDAKDENLLGMDERIQRLKK